MLICIYQKDYSELFRLCHEILKKLNYTIQKNDSLRGILSAFKSSDTSALIDLKLKKLPFSVEIGIYSNSFSSDYVSLFHDLMNENNFIDELFSSIRSGLPANPFCLSPEDYIDAGC
jgi:hypothetical protein